MAKIDKWAYTHIFSNNDHVPEHSRVDPYHFIEIARENTFSMNFYLKFYSKVK